MDPTTKALRNPLVLNLIFSYLRPSIIKTSVRPVCTQWADLGAYLLGERTSVTFSKLDCCQENVSTSKELAAFHPRLARNVNLIMISQCACEMSSLSVNFVTNLPRIASRLRVLHIKISWKLVPALEEMLRIYQFPKLENLIICIKFSENSNDYAEDNPDPYDVDHQDKDNPQNDNHQAEENNIRFPTLPNLSSFSFYVNYRQNEKIKEIEISSICQGLLNSAPNITKAFIGACFYPDFTPCEKISNLVFLYAMEGPDRNVDLSKLTRMVDTCRNSVYNLLLSSLSNKEVDVPQGTFMLPSLPNAHKITLSGIYPLGNFLRPVYLPNLHTIMFTSYSQRRLGLADIFGNFHLPHVGIRTLYVDAMHVRDANEVQIAANMVRLFPSVADFDLIFTISDEDFGEGEDFTRLKETLQSLATWEVTNPSVKILNVQSSTVVLAVLRGLMEWKGFTRTELIFEGDLLSRNNFVLGDEMKEALISCRSICLIEMSQLDMEQQEIDEFQAFINEHNLPIFFQDVN